MMDINNRIILHFQKHNERQNDFQEWSRELSLLRNLYSTAHDEMILEMGIDEYTIFKKSIRDLFAPDEFTKSLFSI